MSRKRAIYRPKGLSLEGLALYYESNRDLGILKRTGCWVPDPCILKTNKYYGYSVIHRNKKVIWLHRLFLERKLGRPLLPGMDTRHKCRLRACFNPDHLEEGTRKDNQADKRRDFGMEPTASLTDNEVIRILQLLEKGHGLLEIANIMNTTLAIVNSIKRNNNYKHIDRTGFNIPALRLTDEQVIEILELLNEGHMTQKDIAARYGVHRATIEKLNNGRLLTRARLARINNKCNGSNLKIIAGDSVQ